MSIKILRFWTNYDGKNPVDYVEFANASAMTETGTFLATTVCRVKEVTPPAHAEGPTFDAVRQVWQYIGPSYEAWKKGEEIPEDGTPLAMWPGLSPEEAKVLARFEIKTVEGVRDIPEALFTRIPLPRIRQKARMAKAFLDNSTKAASAKAQTEQASIIEELQRQIAELSKQKVA
jgi:hypothetical protein